MAGATAGGCHPHHPMHPVWSFSLPIGMSLLKCGDLSHVCLCNGVSRREKRTADYAREGAAAVASS
ncbi:hypothetical protein L195_g001500 [Trifolium pratense]|uniref:Uncharacterized protein n=1 Tax=Trifolium pratense TaxID=57577 RepID=A0A2K3NPU8_TRIPR|nr:hypothetical protein L195_g001500 [Trifolium pratense]